MVDMVVVVNTFLFLKIETIYKNMIKDNNPYVHSYTIEGITLNLIKRFIVTINKINPKENLFIKMEAIIFCIIYFNFYIYFKYNIFIILNLDNYFYKLV